MLEQPVYRRFLNGIVHQLLRRATKASSGDPVEKGTLIIDDPVEADFVFRSPDLFQKNFGAITLLGLSRLTANGEEARIRKSLTQPAYLDAAKSGNWDSVCRC